MFLCCTLILFGSLLVALMWNVCAEPIECCVYIKATLFLTTPVFHGLSLIMLKGKRVDCVTAAKV